MTIFDSARGKVIDGAGGHGSGGLVRLSGIGLAAFLLVILLFSCVSRVGTGHVGVLTLFGKVTGETLGEGIHQSTKDQQRTFHPDADAKRIGQRAIQRRADDEPGHVADLPPQPRPGF